VIHVPQAWPSIGKEFSDATRQTPVGALSDIVPIPSGYAFFYVVQQSPGAVQPFENSIVQRLLPNLVLQDKYQQWRDRKWDEYKIEYHQDRLEACVRSDLDVAMRAAEELRAASAAPPGQATPTFAGGPAAQPARVATPARL
jgi:hypothetical protein